MTECAETIAATLDARDMADLLDIASGARVFTRHIFLFDDGLVQRQLRGAVTDYAACPLEVTALGAEVIACFQKAERP